MRGSRMFVGLVVAVVAVGCGRDERLARGQVVPFAPAASGATPFGDVPFPSDLYLDSDGNVGSVPGIERVLSKPAPIVEGLAALDGFGRSSGALFFLDATVDESSLPRTWDEATRPEASVFIADVDPSSSRLGTRYPAYAKPLPSLGCVSVIPVPGVVLPPGVRHSVVLTTAATSGGAPLLPAEELERIAQTPSSVRTTPSAILYGEALDRLVATGAVQSAADVASLAVFTTSRAAHELFALRDELRAQPDPELILDPAAAKPYTAMVFGVSTVPSLDAWLGDPEKDETGREWPGGDNVGGIAHDQIGAVASGAFVAPSLIDPELERFVKNDSGDYAIADPDALIPVTLALPMAPPPAAGYPVVISGHGLSNNRGAMLSFANELARAGFAVIGIDDVLHGARAGIADESNNAKGPYQGPDGIPDEYPMAVSFFAGFSDFLAVRDNFRQTVLDQCSLVRLIQSSKLDLSPLATATGGVVPKLDPNRIYWSGGSLGGIIGSMTTAVEPEIRAAAFQVPGASFVQLITTGSAKLSGLVTTLASGSFGVQGEEQLDEFHPLAHFLSAVSEAGDPIGYASNVLLDPLPGRAPRDVLVSYAVYDEVLPNSSSVALIRALGLELLTPSLVEVPGVPTVPSPASGNVAGRTAAAVQYSPANHGLGYVRFEIKEFQPGVPFDADPRFPRVPKPFEVEMPIREHADQLVQFFTSANSGNARIEVTAPPVADFDGDGALDSDDASPWDPTQH